MEKYGTRSHENANMWICTPLKLDIYTSGFDLSQKQYASWRPAFTLLTRMQNLLKMVKNGVSNRSTADEIDTEIIFAHLKNPSSISHFTDKPVQSQCWLI